MKFSPREFRSQADAALNDRTLQQALVRARSGFVNKRAKAVAALPEFEVLRAEASAIRVDALNRLPDLLEQFEAGVLAAGGQVHWATDAAEARRIVVGIAQQREACRVAKGKTMVGEEIGINPALEAAGINVVETDLGEYIIQLAQEPPSHIVAPAVHKTREQVAELFAQHHRRDERLAALSGIPELVDEARRVLRETFLSADLGITGGNFLVADSGSVVLVTNEGNGDLSATLPKTHIVIAGIEKVVPTMTEATTLLRVLARSATGQPLTTYTSVFTGARRATDETGPEEFHVVLVDNGRSAMLASELRDMLRCIRCGACMNHCPVYGAIGGHAYGWVYPGPMGQVLTPWLLGPERAPDLAHACTLNGHCAQVCPVGIPLPDLIRAMRVREHESHVNTFAERWVFQQWTWWAKRPALYGWALRAKARWLHRLARPGSALRRLPVWSAWFRGRDLPTPQGRTLRDLMREKLRGAR
ncbi:MAG: lactate utilization protein [Gammaproteobacteria bacterium]|nr:lactate utilization protein [Gammaproteobacteria bacterium]MCP5136292.1 lactate utilization protein [Gammaproteobacteria bacterium]